MIKYSAKIDEQNKNYLKKRFPYFSINQSLTYLILQDMKTNNINYQSKEIQIAFEIKKVQINSKLRNNIARLAHDDRNSKKVVFRIIYNYRKNKNLENILTKYCEQIKLLRGNENESIWIEKEILPNLESIRKKMLAYETINKDRIEQLMEMELLGDDKHESKSTNAKTDDQLI